MSSKNQQAIYTRNLDQMSSEDLMSDKLPTNYLYSKITVGEQAAHFFSGTTHGADFDRRLREKFQTGFEALLAASPSDVAAVSEAQQACLVVIGIYNTIAEQINDGNALKAELRAKADIEDDME